LKLLFITLFIIFQLSITGNITDYVAEHLRKKEFRVTVSAWIAGQLYVLADSPKAISDSLPFSLYLAVKQYVRISDEEREAVERSCRKIPNPAWVRIKHEKYKGDIAQVFDSDLPNDFVAVLVPPRDFPYSMPRGSRSLLDRSRLLNGDAISNISIGEEVIGCKYKGERYYMGLLLKNVHRDRLEPVVCPHADDIQLHLQSGWNRTFLKTTVHAFAMQFLRVGDRARIVKGDLRSEIGQVVSTDYPAGSVTLALKFSGFRKEVDIRLEDIERIFQVGDSVRVVAGPYLGVEGYIIQMVDDIICLCQDVSKEEVNVSFFFWKK
jgi:ribosomal protein L24